MVRVDNIHFAYRKNRPLFSGLHLSLDAGHIYGFIRKEWFWKSTLLKNIAGLAFLNLAIVISMAWKPPKEKVSTLEQIYFLRKKLRSVH
jgi:ABC-2 type transport system ATP-binding protein